MGGTYLLFRVHSAARYSRLRIPTTRLRAARIRMRLRESISNWKRRDRESDEKKGWGRGKSGRPSKTGRTGFAGQVGESLYSVASFALLVVPRMPRTPPPLCSRECALRIHQGITRNDAACIYSDNSFFFRCLIVRRLASIHERSFKQTPTTIQCIFQVSNDSSQWRLFSQFWTPQSEKIQSKIHNFAILKQYW